MHTPSRSEEGARVCEEWWEETQSASLSMFYHMGGVLGVCFDARSIRWQVFLTLSMTKISLWPGSGVMDFTHRDLDFGYTLNLQHRSGGDGVYALRDCGGIFKRLLS